MLASTYFVRSLPHVLESLLYIYRVIQRSDLESAPILGAQFEAAFPREPFAPGEGTGLRRDDFHDRLVSVAHEHMDSLRRHPKILAQLGLEL